jgi:catechol 2,3-dioxygenase-like lactoylglutathione lyase family enzyme
MTAIRVHHVNLVVEDMAAMIAFYRDRLGLRLAREATIRGAWIEAVTGLAGVVADVALLEADGSAGIELIHYRSPEGPRPPGMAAPNTKGLRHVAFEVERIEPAVETLRAAGVRLFGDVQTVPGEQVDYADRTKRIVYCLDPEGNLVELCAFE